MNGKWRKPAAVLVLAAAICMMAFAGIRMSETARVYKEGNAAYDALSEQIKINDSYADIAVYIQNPDIDFDALKIINEDAAAWLYSPGTDIDYPVMKADDYSYYLSHLPDGTYNANGTLFIDYNCASDFSDPLTVIYGHHMKSGKMFGSIVGYKEQGYYEEHPYMYLSTEQENYRIDLIYGCVIGAGQWRDRAFMYKENISSLMAYAKEYTTFSSPVKYKAGDRVVALSTCSYEFDNARYVVIGILSRNVGNL